jgi:hypothetical protein
VQISTRSLVAAVGLAALASAVPAHAASVYPTNQCVSTKQKAAGTYCKAVLSALANWETKQDDAKRDAALVKAADKLDKSWQKAEDKSAKAGVDCVDTTLTSGATRGILDSASGAILDDVNGGLNLGTKADATCGSKLLKAAGTLCGQVLAAESSYIKALAKDPTGAKRDEKVGKANDKFVKSFQKQLAKGCPTNATPVTEQAKIGGATAQIVDQTTVSPNVDDSQFTTISPTGPIQYQGKTLNPECMDGSPYAYFVKRGTVNKLLVYYQGGGACWESTTCGLPVCDTNVNPNGGDNPNNASTGFADIDNPQNPFRDWNIVFVSYCSCDIHYGDASQDYPANLLPAIHVEHRGYQNSRVVEKWAREHFVNPERVFVTGSSAGAYGAWFNGPLHEFVWPASHFDILADAGNGVITQDFLDNEFPHWNFAANLPKNVPGLEETLTNGTGIPGYTKVITDFFPNTRFAHYSTAFDGGTGGQTGFYQVMRNPDDQLSWLNWWESSCAYNEKMTEQVQATFADVTENNYRYYIGTGSRHTMWGSNKVYTDTTGGVPTIVDWVNAMLDGSALWTNVQCTNCGLLLPGDPRPNPLTPPFEQQGSDVVVNCAGSPSGAFL